jgi:hypothetical protein
MPSGNSSGVAGGIGTAPASTWCRADRRVPPAELGMPSSSRIMVRSAMFPTAMLGWRISKTPTNGRDHVAGSGGGGANSINDLMPCQVLLKLGHRCDAVI